MEAFTLVGKIVMEGKENLKTELGEIRDQARSTQLAFRDIERVTRPLGMALAGIGAAGLAFADDVKKWNKGLGEFLETLRPLFVVMTGFGGLLLTLPPIIKGVVIAFNVLKVALASLAAAAIATQAAFGLLALGLSMIVSGISMLVTHTRHIKEVTAETERWGDTLVRTNDRLHDLITAGEGASDEAQNLRKIMDDLIATYDVYNTIGEDNVVTTYNLADAEAKLAEAKEILLILEQQLIDRQTAANKATEIGKQQTENLEASIGNYKNTIVELTLGIAELQDAQDEETQAMIDNADAIRDDTVKALEELYGFRADESKSLLELYNDEVDARKDSLDDQLSDVRKATSDIIKQYRSEYNTKVMLLNAETDAQVSALEYKLGLLDESESADEEAALRKAVTDNWSRSGKADAEKKLADFLAQKNRESLQKQIQDVQKAAQETQAQYQQELDDKTEGENAKLEASEIVINSELVNLQNAANIKRGILQQEFNDAVSIQNAIRDNAIQAMQDVINYQLAAVGIGHIPQSSMILPNGPVTGGYATSPSQLTGLTHYSNGGPVLEDSLLVGMRSGKPYAMAHAGETVTPGGGLSLTVNVNGGVYKDDIDRRKLAQEIVAVAKSELYKERLMRGSYGTRNQF